MTIVIKNKTSKAEIKKLLEKVKSAPKTKSLRKVFGKFTIDGDAIEIQKELRNEWD